MYEVKPDNIDLPIKRDGIEALGGAPRKELSVRSKKPKPGERASKGDGSIILVSRAWCSFVSPTVTLADPSTDTKQRLYCEQAARSAG